MSFESENIMANLYLQCKGMLAKNLIKTFPNYSIEKIQNFVGGIIYDKNFHLTNSFLCYPIASTVELGSITYYDLNSQTRKGKYYFSPALMSHSLLFCFNIIQMFPNNTRAIIDIKNAEFNYVFSNIL
jgi:hypothetical protein